MAVYRRIQREDPQREALPQRKAPSKKRRKRTAAVLCAIVLLLAGAAVLLYPTATKRMYQREADRVNAAFAGRVQQYDPARRDLLYEQMQAYNRELYLSGQAGLVDAFSYEQVDFSLRAFGFEEEMIGYVTIPKMGVELPIYLGASEENLERGATHLSQTSLPVGGENTNAVIAAHRGMPTADMFRHIDKLEPGDEIRITNYREELVYEVVDTAIIDPSRVDRVLIQKGRDMVTLISCNPYGSNTERYVVYAQRVA